ncbi:MAG: type I methionyl aminopeptidase [Eubacteriales bacterium]|nr:type I methionyl aminopeptidase [Eubacteriales bacterium]
MSVTVKSEREIELMREAGRILGTVLRDLSKEIHPGMSTYQVNKLGDEMIRSYGCIPSFLNYQGYPASICTSVNEEVVHGIPSKKRILKDGDIISMDAGVIYHGYHSDAARTVGVGEISEEASKLIERTKQSFFEGIKFAKEGCHLHEISNAIADYNESFGYGVIRDLVGHGIGTELHEEPQIPNFRQERRGMKLYSGMTLAIEPMVSAGGYSVKWLDDDWTVVTQDKSLAAHYENTVLITKNGPEILSLVE